jgi:hypothetical protein
MICKFHVAKDGLRLSGVSQLVIAAMLKSFSVNCPEVTFEILKQLNQAATPLADGTIDLFDVHAPNLSCASVYHQHQAGSDASGPRLLFNSDLSINQFSIDVRNKMFAEQCFGAKLLSHKITC